LTLNEIKKNLTREIRVEFRSRAAMSLAFSFSVITVLGTALAARGVTPEPLTMSLLLWIILFFSAMNGLSHVFTRESERGTLLLLRSVSSAGGVFAAKLIFNIVLFLVIEAVSAPLFLFFFQTVPADPGAFAGILAAGGFSVAAGSSILAAIASMAGARGALFAVISFPVLLPVLWTAVIATERALSGAEIPQASSYIFLLAFSGSVILISFPLFKNLWFEEQVK
jgi:heme exporter protein B